MAPGRYRIYGLSLRSDLPLPELVPITGTRPTRTDLELRLGEAAAGARGATRRRWTLPISEPQRADLAASGILPIHIGQDRYGDFADMHWPALGRCVVRDGRRITVLPAPGTSEAAIRLWVLGPIIGLVLHLRGWLVLHGSGIEMTAGTAIAVLGASGQGKSTTAALLVARGHRLVADDLVAIPPARRNKGLTTIPGFPQLKLWPDAAAAITHAADSLPRLIPEEDKRAHRLPEQFAPGPLPLAAIYLLDPSTDAAGHAAEPLTPADACIELIRNAFGARTFDHMDRARRFTQIARVASCIPVYRLRVRRGFAHLGELADLIESTNGRFV